MTPETESRIRSLAANVLDLEHRIRLLRETNTAGKTLAEQQQLKGDLYVAQRAHYEAQAELLDLSQTRREV